VISNYQYERLEYIIDAYNLTFEELRIIDEFIADPKMDHKLDWLINNMRKRPYRRLP
jgi:hypothetical protein